MSEEIFRLQDSGSKLGLAFCSFVILLHGAGVGAGLVYAGLVLPHHVRPDTSLVLLTEEESTWFASLTVLAMTGGVLLSIPASEKIGRKNLLLVSNLLSVVGYLVIFLATSFLLLMVGRGVQCVGMGLGVMTAGVFLSEICTVRLRGPLVGLSQTSLSIGQVLSTSLCIFLPIQFLAVVCGCYSVLVTILATLLPRSPHWLIRQGREEDTRKSLQYLRGKDYAGLDLEMIEIKNCVKQKESVKKTSALDAFKTRTFLMPLLVFSTLFFLLGMSGNDTFIFYGPTIFADIDVGIPTPVLNILPWIGFLIGYACSNPLMAKVNRKSQYIVSASVMSAAMFVFGILLKYLAEEKSVMLQVFLILSLQVGTIAYGAGVGSIPYAMTGEVFTPQHKTLGACCVQSVRCITVFIFVKLVPSLITMFGLHGLFFLHGTVLAGGAVFSLMLMPETRGKTLTELCALYKDPVHQQLDIVTTMTTMTNMTNTTSMSSMPTIAQKAENSNNEAVEKDNDGFVTN